VDIGQVEGVPALIDHHVTVGVGDQERALGQGPGVAVEAALAADAPLVHDEARHGALGRHNPRGDDADALDVVDAPVGLDDEQRADRQGVMPRGDADVAEAVRDRADLLNGPRVVEVLLEHGIGGGPIGPDDPQGLDLRPVPLLVLPAGVAEEAVVEHVGQVVAILGHTHAPDGAIAPAEVEVAGGLVFVQFVALQREAATLGDEGDLIIGQVAGVQVAPLAVGELPQAGAVDADLEQVDGLDRLAQPVAGRPVQPERVRLLGLGVGVREDDAPAVPVQVHAVDVARPELSVQHRAHLALGRDGGEDEQVAAGPGNPGHVVQADVGVGLLGVALHEEQLVEIHGLGTQGDGARPCPGLEVERLTLLGPGPAVELALLQLGRPALQGSEPGVPSAAVIEQDSLRAAEGLTNGRDESGPAILVASAALIDGDGDGHGALAPDRHRQLKGAVGGDLGLAGPFPADPRAGEGDDLGAEAQRLSEGTPRSQPAPKRTAAEGGLGGRVPLDGPLGAQSHRPGSRTAQPDRPRVSSLRPGDGDRDLHSERAILDHDRRIGPRRAVREHLAVDEVEQQASVLHQVGPAGASSGPDAEAALAGRPTEGDVQLRLRDAVDLDLIQVVQDAGVGGYLQVQIPPLGPPQIDDEGADLVHAAEEPVRLVMVEGPRFAIDRAEHTELVRVVQPRGVVQPVVDHNAVQGHGCAKVDLPPGIRIAARVEAVATVLDAVDGPAGIHGRQLATVHGRDSAGQLGGDEEPVRVMAEAVRRLVRGDGGDGQGGAPAGVIQHTVEDRRSIGEGDLVAAALGEPGPLDLRPGEPQHPRLDELLELARVVLAPVVEHSLARKLHRAPAGCQGTCGDEDQQRAHPEYLLGARGRVPVGFARQGSRPPRHLGRSGPSRPEPLRRR